MSKEKTWIRLPLLPASNTSPVDARIVVEGKPVLDFGWSPPRGLNANSNATASIFIDSEPCIVVIVVADTHTGLRCLSHGYRTRRPRPAAYRAKPDKPKSSRTADKSGQLRTHSAWPWLWWGAAAPHFGGTCVSDLAAIASDVLTMHHNMGCRVLRPTPAGIPAAVTSDSEAPEVGGPTGS